MAAPALGASHIASVNPSQLALAGLPPSTAQQLAQLTATVNSLKLALVQDEQTIQALQQSLTNEELIEWGDKNQMITNLQTVSDNLTQFESATRAGLDEDAMGAMEGFGLACTAVSYTKDSNQQADFKAYTGSEHCGP
ncbi:MAG: hypothetical protein KGQ42_00265 [Alphaproteobacteria bacterium]|nr:hypothetical protein [Alphaproteobacteria bacterium]MDE2041802.1 hypothetical protein [Alphaproteobacteria bacterium]